MRGVPRERYSDEECGLIYWGISAHIGTPVSQNARGHLLGHVTDEGKNLDDPNARGYQTKNRLDFHCDQLPVDVLGLFCLRGAKSGGKSKKKGSKKKAEPAGLGGLGLPSKAEKAPPQPKGMGSLGLPAKDKVGAKESGQLIDLLPWNRPDYPLKPKKGSGL